MSRNERQDDPADMPPLPRDHASSLMSEVIPLRSTTTKFWKSRLLVPGLAAVAATVLMFQQMGNVKDKDSALVFAMIVGLFILFSIFVALHLYSRSRKPTWVFLFPFLFTAAALTTPLVQITFRPIAILFRQVLPGGTPEPATTEFLPNFISMFFGAGMAEELTKILPVLIMVGFGLKARAARIAPNEGFLGALGALTPLDCMLAGAASGAGFILAETYGEYYEKTFARLAQATNNPATGLLFALQLSIPRALGGVVGHMGWSAIFGYFVGLGLRRRSLAAPLFAGGWLVVATMHGFWNSGNHLMGSAAYWLSGLTTLPVLLACLLKARQIEDLMLPRAPEGSIVVGAGAPPPASARATATGTVSAPPGDSAPAPFPPVGHAVPAATAPAGAPSIGYALVVGGVLVPLRRGRLIDLGAVPGLEQIGRGFFAELSTHPTDPTRIGLKNLGTSTWLLVSAAGQTQQVPPQRNARLEAGAVIRFGEVAVSVVSHR